VEFLQLTYFCDAARTENFSRTAEKFNVPTSNISQTVKRLESELGVKLFKRTANKISLSEEGKIFYEGAKRALDTLSETKGKLSADGGEIRLLIQTCRRVVTNAIERYKAECPSVSISISHNAENGEEYDFIISDRVNNPSDYESCFLIAEKIVLATRRGTFKDGNIPTSLSELSNERFISLDGSRLSGFTYSMCREAGFVPNVVIRTDDPYYVRRYVEMGLGVALVPSVSWRGQFSDEVEFIDIGDYRRDTNLFIKKEKILTAYERAFADTLVESFKSEEKGRL
jgi:DNA-binding transcriptional LysR family regulator